MKVKSVFMNIKLQDKFDYDAKLVQDLLKSKTLADVRRADLDWQKRDWESTH